MKYREVARKLQALGCEELPPGHTTIYFRS